MKEKQINLLSLFDGMGGAVLSANRAIEELNLPIVINNYSSSEIEKSALKVLDFHWRNHETINYSQLGDIKKISADDFDTPINLIVFGSPCLQLSTISPNRDQQLCGADSGLFYQATRIISELKEKFPNEKVWIIAENVSSMKNETLFQMIEELELATGEEFHSIKIDSAIHSAAHRRRVYITNFEVGQPRTEEFNLQDILYNGYVDREKANVFLSSDVTLLNGLCNRYLKRNIGNVVFQDEAFSKLPKEEKCELYPSILKESGYEGKNRHGTHEYPNGCYRLLSPEERCAAHQIPEGYLTNEDLNLSKTAVMRLVGEGFNIATTTHVFKALINEFIKE